MQNRVAEAFKQEKAKDRLQNTPNKVVDEIIKTLSRDKIWPIVCSCWNTVIYAIWTEDINKNILSIFG